MDMGCMKPLRRMSYQEHIRVITSPVAIFNRQGYVYNTGILGTEKDNRHQAPREAPYVAHSIVTHAVRMSLFSATIQGSQ
jgi:hypothetical protein